MYQRLGSGALALGPGPRMMRRTTYEGPSWLL
jgi:hypothetical protein